MTDPSDGQGSDSPEAIWKRLDLETIKAEFADALEWNTEIAYRGNDPTPIKQVRIRPSLLTDAIVELEEALALVKELEARVAELNDGIREATALLTCYCPGGDAELCDSCEAKRTLMELVEGR